MSCISCDDLEENEEYDENIKFSIEQESIVYDTEFIEESNVIFTNFALKLITSYYKLKPTESQTQNIDAQYKKTFIPIFIKARIYEEELRAIITELERITNEDGMNNPEVIFDIYEKLLYSVGSQKTGIVAYELAKVFINSEKEQAYSRYEQYGYYWYFEDGERYSAIYDSLCEMGAEKFSAICSMASIIASTALYTPTVKQDSLFSLTNSDLLFVLEYHGSYFLDLNITEEEASTFGAIFSEIIPDGSHSLGDGILYALKGEGYFTNAAKIIPHFAKFYASLTSALRKRGEFDLNGDPDELVYSLLNALADCEAELTEFLDAAEIHMATSSESEISILREYGMLDEANTFLDGIEAIENEEFIARLKDISQNEPEALGEALANTAIARFTEFMPYIVFTLTR
jgi:hypothetical protein